MMAVMLVTVVIGTVISNENFEMEEDVIGSPIEVPLTPVYEEKTYIDPIYHDKPTPITLYVGQPYMVELPGANAPTHLSLPSWLKYEKTKSNNHFLTGTPPAPGVYNVSFKAGILTADQYTYNITVIDREYIPQVFDSKPTPITLYVGQPYMVDLSGTTSSLSLPSWLKYEKTTSNAHFLAGTPTAPGVYSVSFKIGTLQYTYNITVIEDLRFIYFPEFYCISGETVSYLPTTNYSGSLTIYYSGNSGTTAGWLNIVNGTITGIAPPVDKPTVQRLVLVLNSPYATNPIYQKIPIYLTPKLEITSTTVNGLSNTNIDHNLSANINSSWQSNDMPSGLTLSSMGKVSGIASSGFCSGTVNATSVMGKEQTVSKEIIFHIWFCPTLQMEKSVYVVDVNEFFTINFETNFVIKDRYVYGIENNVNAFFNLNTPQYVFQFTKQGLYLLEIVFLDDENRSVSALIFVYVGIDSSDDLMLYLDAINVGLGILSIIMPFPYSLIPLGISVLILYLTKYR